ncbi:MAG: TetR family transcriptional regulator [Nocardioidaceae bacterium]|nr:TetR family transcriptional regulator [Nocardioidaceae bacterium]
MALMARPKEQAARRQELVAAAGRVIVQRGVRGLRVKDVAAQAGISAGLVSYYYPDLGDLLVDVHEHSVDRFYWSRMRLVEGVPDAPGRLRALAAGGLPSGPDDELCLTLYELHLHAARDRTHAALMTSLFDREVSLYAMVLQQGAAAGELHLAAPALDVATNAVALEDAYGLHVVARNSRVDAGRARSLLLSYLAQATGVDLGDEDPRATPVGARDAQG